MSVAFIFSLLFPVLVIVFALQNLEIVTINYFWGQQNISQALVILLSAAFGATIVLLLGLAGQFKSKLRIRKLTKTIKKTEAADRLTKEKEDLDHMERLEEENRVMKEKAEARDNFEANNNGGDDGTLLYIK